MLVGIKGQMPSKAEEVLVAPKDMKMGDMGFDTEWVKGALVVIGYDGCPVYVGSGQWCSEKSKKYIRPLKPGEVVTITNEV